jgi:hypothetical protein
VKEYYKFDVNSSNVSSRAALSIDKPAAAPADAWNKDGFRSSAVVINTIQLVRYFSILLAELL